jgi:hypothetical protein
MTLGRNLSISFGALILISVVPGLLVGTSVRFINRVQEMTTAEKPTSAAAYAIER